MLLEVSKNSNILDWTCSGNLKGGGGSVTPSTISSAGANAEVGGKDFNFFVMSDELVLVSTGEGFGPNDNVGIVCDRRLCAC